MSCGVGAEEGVWGRIPRGQGVGRGRPRRAAPMSQTWRPPPACISAPPRAVHRGKPVSRKAWLQGQGEAVAGGSGWRARWDLTDFSSRRGGPGYPSGLPSPSRTLS